ncbi:MAG: hypothetical protein DELT_02295 [Desulfovibrio sp.]
MISEQVLYTFGWAPWSCIVAGVITALALSALLWILGVALGFTVVSPKSDEPFSGVGLAFGVWGAVSVIASMAGGGFMAGFLAGQRGLEIGFLVWALTILGSILFSGLAIGAATALIGYAVKNIGGGAMSAAVTVGKSAVDTASDVMAELKDHIDTDIDRKKLNEDVMQALRDTGIETLQPEYIRDQLREARAGFRNMLHQLVLNPGKPEEAVCDFLEETKGRIAAATEDIDKDTAITALMNTRGIPREEAAKIVDNALHAYDSVTSKARESIADAREMMEEAKERLHHMAGAAREKADDVTGKAAKTALMAAAALTIAAAVCMGSAYCGAKYAPVWEVAGQTQSITLPR